jgi:hypothetical protein
MCALVVYESMFGNTQKIAEEVLRGLTEVMPAQAVEVGSAPAEIGEDVTLIVVGGPTHAFGMTRPATRKSAQEQADSPLVSRGQGVREWLAAIKVTRRGVAGAAFDSRISSPLMPRAAAKSIAKALRKRGVRVVSQPTGFAVTGTQGPLAQGELDRARRWGAALARTVADQTPEGTRLN